MAEQKTKNTIKNWTARLLALPLGRCLPAIGLCLLLCCMVTGYTVLRLEQKEQYRQDTIVVYQSQPQTSAAAPQLPQKSAAVLTEATDTETTGVEEVAPAVQPGAEGLYATPSGKRYHYDAACPGKNSQAITWEEARQRGLTPCKKCVPS